MSNKLESIVPSLDACGELAGLGLFTDSPLVWVVGENWMASYMGGNLHQEYVALRGAGDERGWALLSGKSIAEISAPVEIKIIAE